MGLGQRGIAKAGFVLLGAGGYAQAINTPAAQGKAGVEMLAQRVGHKHQRVRIKLRIFYREAQFLLIKGEVIDGPGIFHYTLQLHEQVHLGTRRINGRKRFGNRFGLRHLQVLHKIKVAVFVFEPQPKVNGVLLILKVNVVDAGNIHPGFHRIRVGFPGMGKSWQQQQKCQRKNEFVFQWQ